MAPIVHPAARKHGVSYAAMLHAFDHAIDVIELDDEFTMLIGADRAGNLIEVGFVDTDHGPIIIHAMKPARDKYLRG